MDLGQIEQAIDQRAALQAGKSLNPSEPGVLVAPDADRCSWSFLSGLVHCTPLYTRVYHMDGDVSKGKSEKTRAVRKSAQLSPEAHELLDRVHSETGESYKVIMTVALMLLAEQPPHWKTWAFGRLKNADFMAIDAAKPEGERSRITGFMVRAIRAAARRDRGDPPDIDDAG